ncbi:MAG: hypothetical protein JWO05_265 [Gemmatimonadetes bacterium]|nr:hypothetical protein [Gemmatimonadota bacterium]
MSIHNMHAAKTNLSELVRRAERGEEILLARHGTPVARLVPLSAAPAGRRFGALKGLVLLGPEFFDPLPDDELDRWSEGAPSE